MLVLTVATRGRRAAGGETPTIRLPAAAWNAHGQTDGRCTGLSPAPRCLAAGTFCPCCCSCSCHTRTHTQSMTNRGRVKSVQRVGLGPVRTTVAYRPLSEGNPSPKALGFSLSRTTTLLSALLPHIPLESSSARGVRAIQRQKYLRTDGMKTDFIMMRFCLGKRGG